MTEYDKLVLLGISPMLIAIGIGIVWDIADFIRRIYEKRTNNRHTK